MATSSLKKTRLYLSKRTTNRMKYDKNQMLLGRNTSAKNQKPVGKEGNGSTIMGNERRRGMMVKKKKKEKLGKHRGESQWTSMEKKKNRRGTERGDWGGKEESERGTSMHMKERFFCRLAVAATQYFNMLLDPDRPGLAVCVCVCGSLCISGSYKLLSALIWSRRQVIPHCLSAIKKWH